MAFYPSLDVDVDVKRNIDESILYTDWKIRVKVKVGKKRERTSHRNVSRLPSLETIQKLKSCLSIYYLNHARILKIPIFLLDCWCEIKLLFFNLAS